MGPCSGIYKRLAQTRSVTKSGQTRAKFHYTDNGRTGLDQTKSEDLPETRVSDKVWSGPPSGIWTFANNVAVSMRYVFSLLDTRAIVLRRFRWSSSVQECYLSFFIRFCDDLYFVCFQKRCSCTAQFVIFRVLKFPKVYKACTLNR